VKTGAHPFNLVFNLYRAGADGFVNGLLDVWVEMVFRSGAQDEGPGNGRIDCSGANGRRIHAWRSIISGHLADDS
jgi:hypothetical protein